MQYRVYVTDALKVISENTARLGGGSSMKARWADVAVGRNGHAAQDERTAEEIIADISEKAGLTIL